MPKASIIIGLPTLFSFFAKISFDTDKTGVSNVLKRFFDFGIIVGLFDKPLLIYYI